MALLNVGSIARFCAEEVQRQGHAMDVWQDGGLRTCYMLEAWYYALAVSSLHKPSAPPSLTDITTLARMIEPKINLLGFRTHNVRVGTRICPAPERIEAMLDALWSEVGKVEPKQGRNVAGAGTSLTTIPYTADEFYIEFELIHPFGDGNGRVGKILHNWLLGTLHDPVLIHDYFGGGNP